MKRPEGFDPVPPAKPKPAAPASKRGGLKQQGQKQKPQKQKPQKQKPQKQTPQPQESTKAGLGSRPQGSPQQPSRSWQRKPRQAAPAAEPAGAENSAREIRKAARQRRRYERDEVRRFTRRARHRRFAWITAASVAVALVGTVAIAVYSPILALTEIRITGTSAVSADEVHDAVEGQLGTPLALLDSDRLKRELAGFTLIQSYVTETVPPHTLIIHITERKAIGSIPTASGFTVVDPAGVVIEKVEVRPEGIPTIELAGADTDSDVFDSVVEVLLTLPAAVAGQVDRVTAATKDDVTLVLTGAGQRVVWGSAEQSDLKARVLASLMATQDPGARIEYDVTAPLSAVIRGQ